MKDSALVKRLRRGDVSALEEVIQLYTPYVSAIAARVLPGCREDWEEVTADVFLALWDNRDRVRTEQLRSYLGSIARNRSISRLRQRRDCLPLEEDVLMLEGDAPHRLAESRELGQALRRAMDALGDGQRELFVRHYYYGQTVADAAADMGLNLSTAKTWLRRGRETLKKFLEKEGYADEGGDLQAHGTLY